MAVLHPMLAPVWHGLMMHVWCHHHPPETIFEFVLVLIGPLLFMSRTLSPSAGSTILFFLYAFALYLITLGTSITLYRLSPLHPLAKYPGPVLAKVSRLWAMYHAMQGRQHLLSQELFQRYGDVVRTGPDHLIMCNTDAIPVVLGSHNPWHRHPRYALFRPYTSAGSVITILDPTEHRERRAIWNRVFSSSALKAYEPLLQVRVAQLGTALAARAGQPLDLAEWLGFLALDFMGSFSFSGAFDFLARGEDSAGFHALLMKSLASWEALGTIPWCRALVLSLPKTGTNSYRDFARRMIRNRVQNGSQHRDVFYYLLNEDGGGGHPPLNEDTLVNEASMVIVAGSDSTSTALANAIVFLMAHPDCFARLRAELDAAAGEGAPYDMEMEPGRLIELAYLQAIVSETLRLMPAMPNGVQRIPPPDGGSVVVAGHVVPVGTTVQIPTWSLQRDPRYFWPEPETFWPERWLPDQGPKIAEARGQEFRLDQNAYMPFSYGPGSCVGRSLALHEVRLVLAALVRRFDVRFVPGFEATDWTAQLRDVSGLARGKLPVVLSQRE